MGKLSSDNLAVTITLTILITSISACAIHMTKETGEELNPPTLNAAFNIQPSDLSRYSNCASKPNIKIVNAETNSNDLVIGLIDNMESRPYIIKPRELNEFIVEYFKDTFAKSQVNINDHSPKVIEVSIAKAQMLRTLFGRGASVSLKVYLPEIKKEYGFSAEQWTGGANPYRALAYAIHEAVWKAVNDKELQNYILCK